MRNRNDVQISVLLPVYKGMPLLKNSVESILNQKDVNFELLIGNDSPDDKETIDYLNSIIDDRVKVIHHEVNLGLFKNLNYLVTNSCADLVHLWSQDDVMLSNCLERTVKFHTLNTGICFAFSKVNYIDENGNIIGDQFKGTDIVMSPEKHALNSLISGSVPGNIANVSIPKESFKTYGSFNEQLKYCGDLEFWVRISGEKPVGIIQEYLIHLRRHSGQLSRDPKMWLYRIQENEGIYNVLKTRLAKKSPTLIKRALNWRIYNQYFGQYLYLLKNGYKVEATSVRIELKKKSPLIGFWFRYILLKSLSLVKLQHRFLNKLYYNKINE